MPNGSATCQSATATSATCLADEDKREEALEAYRKGLATFEKLAAADHGNTQWQHEVSISLDKIGDVLADQGKREKALDAYRKSLAIREKLVSAEPGNAGWQINLVVGLRKVADAGDEPRARLIRALDILRRLDAQGRLRTPKRTGPPTSNRRSPRCLIRPQKLRDDRMRLVGGGAQSLDREAVPEDTPASIPPCIHATFCQTDKICSRMQDIMRLFTTAEAAEYLRLKERKLYALVAENAIPCTKVTGKWLFPKAELDRWLLSNIARPDGMTPSEPMPIIGGSHDPLLEWSLRESASGLATLPEGSEAGLRRFIRGELVAAAIHLHAFDDEELDANVDMMQNEANLHDAVLIAFVRREVGFLVAPGNPLGLSNLNDVLKTRARMAVRPEGAGAQLFLEALLRRTSIASDHLNVVGPPCPTGPDVAQAVRVGRADCGIAIRAVANAVGLEFIPIIWERFDLVVRQRHYFRPQLQTFMRFLLSDAMAARAMESGGYDLTGTGRVRFSP